MVSGRKDVGGGRKYRGYLICRNTGARKLAENRLGEGITLVTAMRVNIPIIKRRVL